MSVFKRSRRRQFESPGGSYFADPNGTLPRAQERVQQALERLGLDWGYGGETPMSAVVQDAPGARRGLRGSFAGERFSKRSGYKVLARLQLAVPERVLFCQQRKVRKEVLFAKRVAGRRRSPGRGGTYRRRAESQWRC